MFLTATNVRNFIFGVEDSLVSTVGLLAGIAIGGVSKEVILLTGCVLILVEAISMAAGSFLSEASAEEFKNKGNVPRSRALLGGIVMFFSYFLAGFVPLFPYLVFEVSTAFYVSIGCSLLALFMLGIISGSLSGGSLMKRGLRMMFIGGIAIAAGVGAALLLAQYGVVAV